MIQQVFPKNLLLCVYIYNEVNSKQYKGYTTRNPRKGFMYAWANIHQTSEKYNNNNKLFWPWVESL